MCVCVPVCNCACVSVCVGLRVIVCVHVLNNWMNLTQTHQDKGWHIQNHTVSTAGINVYAFPCVCVCVYSVTLAPTPSCALTAVCIQHTGPFPRG